MKIGIDMGGSHIGIGLVDNEGKILLKEEHDILKEEGIDKIIINYIDKYIAELTQNYEIDFIGIAGPGNPENGCITNIVNLGINKLDFNVFKEKYNINIKVINDAKAAALAEKRYGALSGYSDSVFLCLGTGIGGAVFLNDILLRANKNPGFEIGHTVIGKNGVRCNCGKEGCFETFCSIKRFKNNIINKLQEFDNNYNIDNPKELIEQIKQIQQEPDDVKKQIVEAFINEYIDNLIIGLSNIKDIFEPEVICLGGGFTYFKDILYERLVQEFEKRRYVFNKDILPKIVLADLGNDAGIIGATLI